MSQLTELLRQNRKDELWQMCCGFIDLSLGQFMAIQRRLLLNQIEMLRDCELGRKMMRGAMPETVEEFREQVPLTTYADYCPELLEQREDVLPTKPVFWQHTSGKSGEYPFKWVPVSERLAHELGTLMFGVGVFASCEGKGDVSKATKEHPKIVYAVAPKPYTSGVLTHIMQQEVDSHYLPPLEKAESMPFEKRVQEGFRLALSQGFDYFFGLSLVLVAVGEQFKQHSSALKVLALLSQPRALFRLTKGLVKSKLARRPMLPRDLWSVKGIMGGGTDSVVFRERVKNLWGRYPLDTYVCTEATLIATQTWDYDSMTFIPSLNFLEFIPEAEYGKWQLDHSYQPGTVLLDEVKAGENYEIVITNFHGGAMVRYRVGDMVRITALRNEKLGIDIPQMVFERRADDLIDLGPIRLTEKVIWQAIENTTIPYTDWTARKEIIRESGALHLYLELKGTYVASERDIAAALYQQLKRMDTGFVHKDLASMERLLDFKPIEVTLLAEGAFANYIAQRQAEGADLAHLKPPHVNPSEKELSWLGVEAVPPEGEAAARAKRQD